jgi:proteasome accessory factor C
MSSQSPNASLEGAARLLDLVPFLNSHQGISLVKLAEEFEISTEEMTQDLMTLWMCGLPGYTAYELIDLSFESGFVTISNAQTLENPRTLERNEALALILGLETLLEEVESINSDLGSTLSELITKLSVLLDASVTSRVRAGTATNSAMRAEIALGIKERKDLKLSYFSTARDEVTQRTVKPLEFATRGGVEYLDAFCLTSGGYRTFRVDRVRSVSATLSASEISEGELVSGNVEPVKFLLEISARFRDAAERFALDARNTDFSERIEVKSYSPEWAIREIMAFGGDIAVVSPTAFRDAVRSRATRTLAQYEA